MIKVIEPAVVLSAVGRSKVKVGTTQEFGLDLTSSLTSGSTVGHQLFVCVEMNIDMQRYLLL